MIRLALAGVLACAAVARADDTFVAKTQVYVDNDATTVVSPLVRISKDVWTGGTVGAGFVADVVSSASVDVITNATTHMSDFRREVSGTLAQKFADTTLNGAYIYSIENDYQSHNLHVGVSQDLARKNVTLALGYSLSLDDVGRSGDANFHRGLDVHTVDASYAQVLGPKTIGQLSYTLQYASGYMASPYRYVRIETSPDFKVPETMPDTRIRNAAVLAINRHVGESSAIGADYRFYYDDWGVSSHTFQFRYFVGFGPLELRLRARFYYQSGAFFYQKDYFGIQPYVTTDRELSDFFSTVVGGKLSWKIPLSKSATLELEAKLDVFYFAYFDYAFLSSRTGADIRLGAALAY